MNDWAITDCVRPPAPINAPSGMITHEEETDVRVGRSDAPSLSVKTVRVVHALLCICSFKPISTVPQGQRKSRFEARRSAFCTFCLGPRQTVRGESDVWRAWSKELTLAHHSPQDSVFLGARFVLILVVIVACQSRSDHGICIRHAVFFLYAFHMTCGWQLPDGIIATQVPRTHIRLCGTG